jgi:hypothetical protein
MDPNSTNYGGTSSGAGSNSTLGAGTDSLGVTGTGAGQGGVGQGGAGTADQSAAGGAQGGARIGERLSDARDAAADRLSQARDAASERLGQARERAGDLKSTLADKLQQGAQSLRQQGGAQQGGAQQGGGQQLAGANGATVDAGGPSLGRYATPAAAAMERTAEFLRGEGDLKGVVEEQVRTNPGRTLLIAVGVGYLLGKAIRR